MLIILLISEAIVWSKFVMPPKSCVLNLIITFNKVPLGNNFQDTLSKSIKASSYNLSLNRCKSCGHFQLGYLELLLITP